MRRLAGVGAGALVLVLAAGGSAFAADASMDATGATWQGGYIGIQGGYGTGDDNATIGATGLPDVQLQPSGWVAGGQIGFNWEFANSAVFGVEGAFNATGLTDGGTGSYAAPPTSIGNAAVTQKLDGYGTFRARMGFDMNGVLPYITGGVAFGKGSRSASATGACGPNPPICSGSESKTFTGWTAGAGAEIAVGSHWSIRGEYSYLDLGTQNFAVPGPSGGSDVELTANIVTGAINYRW
jgi:outer membrane immunogenic protein